MGKIIPSIELYGNHQCHYCDDTRGPHYFDGKRIMCMKCENQKLEHEARIAVVMLIVVAIAFAALATWFVAL